MTTVISALYPSHAAAEDAVERIRQAGIGEESISAVWKEAGSDAREDPVRDGAPVGALAGAAAGLFAGVGAIVIPGFGPVVAAGWLASTLFGAGLGGIAGGLVAAGWAETDATRYARLVQDGGRLLVVRVEPAEAAQVRHLLSTDAMEVHTRPA